jgi:plastocyanin
MNPDSQQIQVMQKSKTGSEGKKAWLTTTVLAVVVVAGIAAGVILTNREATRQASAASAPAAEVTIAESGLSAPTLTVQKDQSVIWRVEDSGQHQLTLSSSNTDAPGFGAGARLAQGETYSYVFGKTGTFYYYDALHPLQYRGEVIVTD